MLCDLCNKNVPINQWEKHVKTKTHVEINEYYAAWIEANKAKG